MNKHFGWTLAATALALTLGSPAARADDGVASASFENMQVLLYDLVPQDGIAPSVAFAAPQGLGSSARSDMLWSVVATTSGTPFGTVSSSMLGNPSEGAAASVSGGDPSGNGTSLFASAYANSSREAHGGSEATLGDGEYNAASFTLSPGTVMVISGHASISASITGVNNNSFDSVTGQVGLQLFSADPHASQSSTASAFAVATQLTPIDSTSTDLTLSFANLSNAAVAGTFMASVRAQANIVTSPVPEPASSSLLLVGLVGLGLLARRRAAR